MRTSATQIQAASNDGEDAGTANGLPPDAFRKREPVHLRSAITGKIGSPVTIRQPHPRNRRAKAADRGQGRNGSDSARIARTLPHVVLATRGLWSDAARRSSRSRHSRRPSQLPNSRHCPKSQTRRAAGLHENKKRRQQTRAWGGLARRTGHPAARVLRRATHWFAVLQTRRFPTHAAGYLEI